MEPDSSHIEWLRKTVLIIGRASPEPSKRHFETVCTGGITESGEFVRLYPISYRYLEREKRYQQWSWAEFEVRKNPSDRRKESYLVREESISVKSRVESTSERLGLLMRGLSPDRETLDVMKQEDHTSIGLIEIDILEFIGRTRRADWAKEKPFLKQTNLYLERKPLEQPPIDLQVRFRCKSNPQCKEHLCRLIGWEYTEALRKFIEEYGSLDGAFERLRHALEKRFGNPANNTFALMGTHFRFGSWMLAQLYAFPPNVPGRLF